MRQKPIFLALVNAAKFLLADLFAFISTGVFSAAIIQMSTKLSTSFSISSSTTINFSTMISYLYLGLFIGAFEWMIFRKSIENSVYWIFASIIGIFVAFLINYSVSAIFGWPFFPAESIVIGICLGFSQWLLLHRNFRFSEIWFMLLSVGWSLIFIINLLPNDIWYRGLLAWLCIITMSLLKGPFLLIILQHPFSSIARDSIAPE